MLKGNKILNLREKVKLVKMGFFGEGKEWSIKFIKK